MGARDRGVPESLPVLAGQASMWAAEQLGTIGRPYNLRTRVSRKRTDTVDEAAAVRACEALIERHPSMWIRLPANRGVPAQVFDRPALTELRHCSSDDPDGDAGLTALVRELGEFPIDLENGPLTQAYVLAAKTHIHVVVLQHHCVTDAISQDVISRDLGDLLGGELLRDVDDFFEVSSLALALEQEGAAMAGPIVDEFTGALPREVDFPSEDRTGNGAIQRMYIDGLADQVSALATQRGVSRLAIVTAGVAAAVGAHVADEWQMGIVATTRPGRQVRVTGCFVNTVPLAVKASWATASPAVLSEIAGIVRQQLSYRHVPMTAWARAWRRRGLEFPTPERVTLSLFPSVRDRLPRTGVVKGMRDGISLTVGFGVELGLAVEHPHHLMTEQVATDILYRLGTALRAQCGVGTD